MSNSLKVLFICNKSPWPAGEGGPIAMNNLIKGLIDTGHQVKVLAVNSNKYAVDPDDIPHEYKKATGIELAYINLSIKPIDAFLNLFTKKSYHVERFISSSFKGKLIEILEKDQFDIVQVETLYMSPYLEMVRQFSDAKIFLRAHNIEHMIWQRIMESTKNPVKKWYLKHLVNTLKDYEFQSMDKYDGIIPISDVDAKFFKSITTTPVKTISFGIDTSNIDTTSYGDPENALFHIGSMNWVPNIEGIKWFLEEAWPLIHDTFPDLKLYLAGRGMSDWIPEMNLENVIVVGEVPDAYEFIKSKSISIAPLFSGSGIRIKIIESMAQARAVISTTIGAEGIKYTNGKNIMIADDKTSYLEAVKWLYSNPEKSKEMGEDARNLILQQHNSKKLIMDMVDFYREVLK
jgi:glycosyltransferase involved in cell wall biosynthesis